MAATNGTMYHRETGKIKKVAAEDWRGEGSEPNTVNVDIEFNGGSYQSFGGLALDKADQGAFISLLMATFGVSRQEDLVGQECVALRPFGRFNESIEGLESVKTSRKFTIRGFRRAVGYPAPSRIESEEKSLRSEIARAEQRIADSKQALKRLKDNYIEWD